MRRREDGSVSLCGAQSFDRLVLIGFNVGLSPIGVLRHEGCGNLVAFGQPFLILVSESARALLRVPFLLENRFLFEG